MYVRTFIQLHAKFCLDTKQIEDQRPELGAVLPFPVARHNNSDPKTTTTTATSQTHTHTQKTTSS